MDSVTVQQTVQTVTGIGSSFIPAAYQAYLPLITFLVTSITGAIIHAVKVGQLKRQHAQEVNALQSVAK